jgi:hypothetical protein
MNRTIFLKESGGEKMYFECNKAGSWICLESAREINLFYVVAGIIAEIPNNVINADIQKVANSNGYDEIDLILDGIDAQSAKELAQDMINKVFIPKGIH